MSFGGYDYFQVPFWSWWRENRKASFRLKNRTNQPLMVGWWPYGGDGGEPTYRGEVTIAPRKSVIVRPCVRVTGVVFTICGED